MVELVDTADSKSADSNIMWVQFPLAALHTPVAFWSMRAPYKRTDVGSTPTGSTI